ncbi:MAG TPA: universal stress protein, partial [Gemmatimonadales bacterium]|nr:universal stress protein [Gemmatimonadales bacterium]
VHLDHIVAAVDQSAEGRSAIQAALALASRTSGRVTALSVEPLQSGLKQHDEPAHVGSSGRSRAARKGAGSGLRQEVRYGLPGVEICRFAEDEEAGLVVLGRKNRSTMQRLMLGDTADEVVRRSLVPCLAVRAGVDQGFARVLAAIDGTERGLSVLFAALDLTRSIDGKLRVVTVEPYLAGDAERELSPSTRSARLAQSVDRIRLDDEDRTSWDRVGASGDSSLVIRRGQVVEEILAEVTASGADVLVIGYHRGGPAGVIEAGSAARRVLHHAECAVLTVPL